MVNKLPNPKKEYKTQPAPADNILVCFICRFDPETCRHNREADTPHDPEFCRRAIVWCSGWEPMEKEGPCSRKRL